MSNVTPIRPRPRTENVRRMSASKLEAGRVHLRLLAADGIVVERPTTRGDCVDGERPCPWVSCRHHLYLDATLGSIKYNFGADAEIDELEHSCSLDIADDGGVPLEDVGSLMNVTRERIRQIQAKVIAKVKRRAGETLGEFVDGPLDQLTVRNTTSEGRLGGAARVQTSTVDEDDDYVPRARIWPEDIYECAPEHDALASAGVWRAYLRDSHSRGIGLDLTTPSAQRVAELEQRITAGTSPEKEQHMLGISDARREDIHNAVKRGAHTIAAIGEALSITKAAAANSIKTMVADGGLIGVGNRAARRYYLPGQEQTATAPPASTPRAQRAPRALAAAAVTASHGGGSAARDALLALRAKAQAKVDAIDEVLAQLGAS